MISASELDARRALWDKTMGKDVVLDELEHSFAGDMRRLYVEGMTSDEARRAMLDDPEYIKKALLTQLKHSGGGDMRRLYKEGMTSGEALRARWRWTHRGDYRDDYALCAPSTADILQTLKYYFGDPKTTR